MKLEMLDNGGETDKQQFQKAQEQWLEQQRILNQRRQEQEQLKAKLHQEQIQLAEWQKQLQQQQNLIQQQVQQVQTKLPKEAVPSITLLSTIGALSEFNIGEDWNLYQERLEQYFVANQVLQERKVAVLITLVGQEAYKILKDLCDPVLPESKSYEELCEILKKQFVSRVSVFKERIEFYELKQTEKESVNEWFARIKNKAINCKFGMQLDDIIKDRFVTGLSKGQILDRVCEEEHTATLQSVLEVARKEEAALVSSSSASLMDVNNLNSGKAKSAQVTFQTNTKKKMTESQHQGSKEELKCVQGSGVLQSLNQQPGQPINMQNKMLVISIMPSQPGDSTNYIDPIQTMQNNPMLTQMNQMGQGNIPPQMNQMVPGQMGQLGAGQMQQNMQSQMQNQLPGQMNNQITGPIGNIQTSMPQQMNQIGPGQLGPGQMQQQLNHIQRKPGEMMNAGFPGPRNVTPNQFLRQSPSPSAPSPAGLGAPASNQMVASPALVPSPSPQHAIMTGPTRSVNSVGMAPSPSSSLNTPGGVGATSSPQEDQAYRDKVRQLSKYIEPLRRMIAKMSSEGNVDKLSKMKKLLEILSNPSKRMPLDTLLKCEVVLEKLDFKRGDGSVGPPVTTLKEHQIFSPLLEAVSAHLQSPVINHTLQRTFGPCLDALFGPEIKNLPPPLKKQKIEESPSEIPDVLQGEIARLDQRFKVSLDPAQQSGSKCIQLICWLDDRHLPCVPPISVTVPADYPSTPPRCVMAPHEYEATTFLCAVQKALNARIAKLPRRFSLSQLLDTWEMSVRQASAPKETSITASTVLMGL